MACSSTAAAARTPRAQGTLLVADRDPRVASVLAEMLSALGYVGLPCSQAADALAIADTGCLRGALVESELRGHDGASLVDTLRENHPALPLGVLEEADDRLGVHLIPGCRVELAKPARLADLERAARILVASRHLVAV